MKEKKDRLFNALAEFKSKEEPTTKDFLLLFSTFKQCTHQGSGLLWSDIIKILIDVGIPKEDIKKGGWK